MNIYIFEVSVYKIEATKISLDPTDSASYSSIEKAIIARDIGLLISNFSSPTNQNQMSHFHHVSKKSMNESICTNMLAATNLTRMILPCMSQKNKGAVVHVSSTWHPVDLASPYNAIHSASSAFVENLFESLRYEYKNTRIVFQCVYKSKNKRPSTGNVLRTLGWSDRTVDGWSFFSLTVI